MDIASYLVIATTVVFIVGATFAFVWSVTSGQWRDLSAQARIPLEDDDAADSVTREVSR
jgi:cbb3-type cytochrome oxidase maturation protein